MSEQSASGRELTEPDRWAAVHTLFAECFKEPTEGFIEEVRSGRLTEELGAHETALDLDLPETSLPDPVDRETLQRTYLSLFEAMEQPFAPPVESPYKPWYGDRDGGLLEGPSATDMDRRYEAIDASPPPAYPADHIALLLEYGGLLLEAGAIQEYRTFLAEHLDWIPALACLIGDAAADAPFYEYLVTVLEAVLVDLRSRLAVEGPAESEIDAMLDRVDSTDTPGPEDTVFDP